MPKIDVNAPIDDVLLRSAIVYGVSRAGKTTLCSTFPRPVIFASTREGGYRSIQTMDRDLWYERDHAPLIYAVGSIKETVGYFREVQALIQKDKVRTIIVELSFYSDDVVATAGAGNDKDGWAKYRILDEHIRWIDTAAKKLNVRVAYNALAADPGDVSTKAPAGISLAGKALARKLPASTDLTGYMRTEVIGGRVDRILHLTDYGAYPAGHRYGSKLPPFVRNPTFRKLEDLVSGRAVCDDIGQVLYGEQRDALVAQRVAMASSMPPESNAQTPPTAPEDMDFPDLSA